MANCERCGKEIEKRRDIPRFRLCETEVSGICCSGYGMFEVDLCGECLEELAAWMEVRNG